MSRVSSSASVSAAKSLVGVMSAVVVSFALATVVTESYDGAVADLAEDIIGNAMPSVEMLSAARGDLRVLENDLEKYASAPPARRADLRDDVTSVRLNIEQSLATYASLPFFPSERALYAHVEENRAHLDSAIDALLSDPEPEAVSRLRHQIDVMDAGIQRSVSFDAAQGQRLGLRIQAVHGRAAVLNVLLDGVSVLLAVLATVLALRQLRRAARAREAERAAREHRERELAEQNEALGQFAGRVAHDVLSPLGAAQLAFDLLRGTSCQEASAQRVVDRGVTAIRRVQTLVDGLLAFSRAGGHPEPGVSTDIAPVIADVIDELDAQAKQRDIAVNVTKVPDGAVACSAGVLTSIVSNLVRNAIKYMSDTTDRRIDVRVSATRDRWRFEVEDTGPGIPAEEQQRVFEPYVQLGRRSSGIGLGLATVDRLVRAHGGVVGLISDPGRGALFWFELPAWDPVPQAICALERVSQRA